MARSASASSSTPRRPSTDIELYSSLPSRSTTPGPLANKVSFSTFPQDYGATSTPTRLSLDGRPPSSTAQHEESDDEDDTELMNELEQQVIAPLPPKSERWERAFALMVACLLSVGSHYGSYLLGPLKGVIHRSQGTSNTQFSLLLAALSLNNTWTPLVGGLLTAKLGTPRASILATSIIFLGQLIVLLSVDGGEDGAKRGNLKGMAAGLFIFGMGVSPLAVVQETIIVRYFSNHGLGVSLALGLVAGKGASFISSITSYPLAEKYGTRGPFVVSTSLAGLSFAVNILYLIFHARLHPTSSDSHKSDEAAAERVIQKRKVKLMNLSRLGDVFWIYILMNVFSGAIWSPFLHLSSNIIQRRFQLPDSRSASYASLLLAGAIFLYPLAGFIHDLSHRRQAADIFRAGQPPSSTIVYRLLTIASCLTLFCYAWLAAPAEWTQTPVPALLSFGIGHGFATLLLVLVVPGIVEPEWVSTALGTHKSMEAAATTLAQTLSGLVLDTKSKVKTPSPPTGSNSSSEVDDPTIPPSTYGTWLLLFAFLVVNVLQLLAIVALWRAFARRCRSRQAEYDALPKDDEDAVNVTISLEDDSGRRLLHHPSRSLSTSSHRPLLWSETGSTDSSAGSFDLETETVREEQTVKGPVRELCSEEELQRGRWFFGASLTFLLVVWATFGGVSLSRG